MWLMARQWGVLFEVRHLMLEPLEGAVLPVLGLQQLVQVAQREVAGLQVQADAVVEGEALAAGVGNCVARPGGRSSSWFFSRMPLSSLTPSGSTSATAAKTPLGIFPPAPMRRSPGHTLMLCGLFWGVWLHPLVRFVATHDFQLQELGALRRQGAVRRCVHGHALAVADDQRGVRPPGLGGEELPQPRLGLLQRGARLLADPQPLHEVEDAGVGAHVLRELVPVPAGQVADELAVLQRRADGPPGPGVQHGRQLPEVSSAFSPTQARSAQSAMSSCVISSTTSQSSFCALPPRTCLRTQWSAVLRPQPQVLRGAVRLGHQVHRLAQPRNNGPGQVRLSGARQAREQQGVAREAVAYRVVHPVPPPLFGALRLHARRPAAQQRLRLFHAVDRRAVRVAQRLQRPQPLREALRQPLRQQAVRLRLRQVARRRVQDAPGLGHHAVLKAQHRVVDGAVGAVAQQPPRVDEVPHHAPLVGEGLGEVRARAVQLAACCCARCRPPPCCAPTGLSSRSR